MGGGIAGDSGRVESHHEATAKIAAPVSRKKTLKNAFQRHQTLPGRHGQPFCQPIGAKRAWRAGLHAPLPTPSTAAGHASIRAVRAGGADGGDQVHDDPERADGQPEPGQRGRLFLCQGSPKIAASANVGEFVDFFHRISKSRSPVKKET